ncbi:MAG: hypothetical protein MJA83_01100, partial [Gammaproteobacteria bacterium]|nr:hypothetical protein [Gammaproteobacteria bacterium]
RPIMKFRAVMMGSLFVFAGSLAHADEIGVSSQKPQAAKKSVQVKAPAVTKAEQSIWERFKTAVLQK